MSRYRKGTLQHRILYKLDRKHRNFVIEYVKDFDKRRAAEASGYSPDTAHKLLSRDDVGAAIDYILDERLEASDIDAEWLLMELVDNAHIAKQTGKIAASNTALGMIGKHCSVDAFAADKIKVEGADVIVSRLKRGRERNIGEKRDDEVSFF